MAGPTDVDLVQVVSQQAQLEEMVEDINHAIHTIKQLLERTTALPTIRGRTTTEGLCVEEQVIKATTRGKAKQVTWSQAESTYSATTTRRKHDELGTSWPHNKTALGCPTRLEAPMKSREREPTEDALRPSSNEFDRLGWNRDKDMRTYLETRYDSATFKSRDDLLAFYPINDKINKLKDKIDKLASRNTEATTSTTTSPFSAEIQ